jgi:decaprenyl-phosphate phosphoribosyltransferase
VTMSTPVALVRALRPRQWVKNVLVFAAPAAAGMLTEGEVLVRALVAFAVFCAAASATYLVNDVLDVERDRRHPTKQHRPIAARQLSEPVALVAAVALAVAAVAVAFVEGTPLGLTVLAYLGLTTAYTVWLKHIAVLDILAVASGFVLRAVAGGAATDVPISEWFFIVASAGALFMVAGKRASEVAALGEDAAAARPILDEYSPSFLVYLRSVASGVVLVSYCLWAFNSVRVADGGGEIWFQLSILPFAAAILRYGLLIDQGAASEPERLVLSDRVLLGAGAVWAIIYGYAVYVS